MQGVTHCAAGATALVAVAYIWPGKIGPGPMEPFHGFQRIAPLLDTDPPPPRI